MGTTALTCYQIDAFTSTVFGGNPAAVVLLPRSALPLPDVTRQQIAAEKNLSETAFLECAEDSNDDFSSCSRFRLRWFTPAIEVPLCGHATLASAAAIFFGERNPAAQLAFDTLSGQLLVTREQAAAGAAAAAAGTVSSTGSSGSDGAPAAAAAAGSGQQLLSMDLPLIEPSAADLPAGMGPGSELVQAAVGDLPVQEVLYAASLRYLVIVLKDEGTSTRQALLSLKPNNQQLGDAHSGGQLVGVIVTLQGDGQQHDLYSRFFVPWAGIAEDPVTGSAHSVLGPYWARQLGRQQLRARQCSPRGGELLVTVKAAEGRVVVAGHAVTVFEGKLLLPAP